MFGMKMKKPALVAGLLVLALSSPAFAADDFIAVCKAGTPTPDNDKVCGCMSDKITGADRPIVIATMRKMNDAMAKGGALDPSTFQGDQAKAIATTMEVQMKCM